ncbi:unnamed protein product [Acanthosepion pharaonis]|uniref:Uncharacterized protein n=1 Tax=Acanthosepion pharaonis TaxID=158019 RepID=A0A812DDK4_ACAPH|nr:unnamed protein product [Sepia pharaonis]
MSSGERPLFSLRPGFVFRFSFFFYMSICALILISAFFLALINSFYYFLFCFFGCIPVFHFFIFYFSLYFFHSFHYYILFVFRFTHFSFLFVSRHCFSPSLSLSSLVSCLFYLILSSLFLSFFYLVCAFIYLPLKDKKKRSISFIFFFDIYVMTLPFFHPLFHYIFLSFLLFLLPSFYL